MSKNRRLLLGGAIAGLIVMNCFCCVVFRTRIPEFAPGRSTPDSMTMLASSAAVLSLTAAQDSQAIAQRLPFSFVQQKKELTSPSLYDMMLENRKDSFNVCPITPTHPKSSSN